MPRPVTEITASTQSGIDKCIQLRLYIAAGEPISVRAIANLNGLCERYLKDRCEIEIVDVFEEPRRSFADGVLVTPTLIKVFPAPLVKIVGDLGDPAMVPLALGLDHKRGSPQSGAVRFPMVGGQTDARQESLYGMIPFALYAARAVPNYGATWISASVERLTGFSPRRFVEDSDFWSSRLHPDDRPRVLGEAHSILSGGTVTVEYRWLCADDAYRWFQGQSSLIRDESGLPSEIVGSWADITDRKLAEHELRASEERFRHLAENIDQVFRLCDPERKRLVYISPAYEKIWGRDRQSLYEEPRSFIEAIHPVDRQRVVDIYEHKFREGFDVEYRIERTDGNVRWIRDRGFPIRDEGGEVFRSAGIAEDVTELKRRENELKERALRQSVIADLAQHALSGSDASVLLEGAAALVVLTFQVRFCEVLELLADEETLLLRAGVGWHEDSPGEVRLKAEPGSQARYTLASNDPVVFEDLDKERRFRGSQHLGERGVVSGVSIVIQGRDRPFGLLGAYSTEQRAYSQDEVDFLRAVANLLAVAISRLRIEEEDQANREALTALASQLTLAEEQERRRIALHLHDQTAQRLALAQIMLGKLLEGAASESQASDLEELRGLLQEVIESTRSLSFDLSPPVLYDVGLEAAVEWLAERTGGQYGIRFIVENDDRVKPLEEELRVVLFAAVRELVTNIVKHARARTVHLVTQRIGDEVRIEVADDGVGFDPSAVAGRMGREGGFGLFSIRERLRRLGGRLEIYPEPGRGTTVVIFAPLSDTEFLSMGA